MKEFHPEATQVTASEELAQGPYVAARAGFEPTTLWSKGFDSTKAPPRPTSQNIIITIIIIPTINIFTPRTVALIMDITIIVIIIGIIVNTIIVTIINAIIVIISANIVIINIIVDNNSNIISHLAAMKLAVELALLLSYLDEV